MRALLQLKQDRWLPAPANDVDRRSDRAILAQAVDFLFVVGERFHPGKLSLLTGFAKSRGDPSTLENLSERRVNRAGQAGGVLPHERVPCIRNDADRYAHVRQTGGIGIRKGALTENYSSRNAQR